MFGKKKNEKIQNALSGKVKDYVTSEETVLNELGLGNQYYIVTNSRVIILQSTNKKGKRTNCKSFFYKDVTNVQYLDIATKKLPYDTMIIHTKGGLFGVVFNLTLPTDFAKDIYNNINIMRARG